MIHAIVEAVSCSLLTDDKALLLKTTPIALIKHREIELVPTKSPHSCCLAFVTREHTLPEERGEHGGER